MSTRVLTLTVPASLAQELDSASQKLLVEILERGLRELKIERALKRYARRRAELSQAMRAGIGIPVQT